MTDGKTKLVPYKTVHEALSEKLKRDFSNKPAESYEPLTFGELKVGDYFIYIPLPKNNDKERGFKDTKSVMRKIRNEYYDEDNKGHLIKKDLHQEIQNTVRTTDILYLYVRKNEPVIKLAGLENLIFKPK